MNKIVLTGNLTRDPQMTRKTDEQGNEMVITRFDLAVNRKNRDVPPDYFHCTSFGRQAEFIGERFHKGSAMNLVGRVKNNNYTTREGNKVYGYNVITEEVEFGDRKKPDRQEESAGEFPADWEETQAYGMED